MDWILFFWFLLIGISFIAEILTAQLVSIWFIVGGVFGAVACLCGVAFFYQVFLFLAISLLMLVLLRPFIKNILRFKIQKTNADRLIGKTAVVTEKIDNLSNKGSVLINGITWSARSLDGDLIESGDYVKISSISGTKMIVHKVGKS